MFCDSQIEFVISSATGSLNPPQEIEASDDVKQCASSCKMHKCLVLLSQLLNIDILKLDSYVKEQYRISKREINLKEE